MATGTRAGTHVVAVLEESTAFNTKEAAFDANKKRLASWDLNPNFIRQAVENQAVRADLGEHKPGLGLQYVDSELSFSAYVEGLETAAGDGVTPTATFQSHLAGASLGGTPAASTGSLTGVATSVSSVQEDLADEHAERSLVAFGVVADGKVYMRPVGDYTTDVMTLLMELPTAPATAGGDIIYGGFTVKTAETALYIIQGEVLGKNDAQSYEFFGCLGNFSIPEASPSEAQAIAYTLKPASATRPTGITQIAPTQSRPLVAAGGEFLIANHDSATTKQLDVLRIGLETGRTYAPDPLANDDSGICGWVNTDMQIRITLTVRDVDTPPAGGAATWYDAWGSNTPDTDNDFHILSVWGQRLAGRLFGVYAPRCHLVAEPETAEVDGLAAWKLTFGVTQGPHSTPTITTKLWLGIA